jgi:hypothetical protein
MVAEFDSFGVGKVWNGGKKRDGLTILVSVFGM